MFEWNVIWQQDVERQCFQTRCFLVIFITPLLYIPVNVIFYVKLNCISFILITACLYVELNELWVWYVTLLRLHFHQCTRTRTWKTSDIKHQLLIFSADYLLLSFVKLHKFSTYFYVHVMLGFFLVSWIICHAETVYTPLYCNLAFPKSFIH